VTRYTLKKPAVVLILGGTLGQTMMCPCCGIRCNQQMGRRLQNEYGHIAHCGGCDAWYVLRYSPDREMFDPWDGYYLTDVIDVSLNS